MASVAFSFGSADNAFHDWIIQVYSQMRLSFVVVLVVVVAIVLVAVAVVYFI